MPLGSGESKYGYFFMKASRAAPLTAEQYWKTPTCLAASVSPWPPADQWVIATCWPSGNVAPSSSFEVHGTAMNLLRRLSDPPPNFSAIASSSCTASASSAIVLSYQSSV